VISRSGVVISITNCYIRFTLLTLGHGIFHAKVMIVVIVSIHEHPMDQWAELY